MSLKFELTRYSDRREPIECAIFVVHEPYVKAAGNNYRGTGAAVILRDGTYFTGVTLCSPHDQFVRSLGRAKAIGRAFQQMHVGIQPDRIALDSLDLGERLKAILREAIVEMRSTTDALEI